MKREYLKEWFSKHRGTKVTATGLPTTLRRKEPGTSINHIYHVLVEKHGTLMVYGDLGEAIYRWSDNVSFEWIANLDLHYFHGKCQASEKGSRPYGWDSDKVKPYIKEGFPDEYDKLIGGDIDTFSESAMSHWIYTEGMELFPNMDGECWSGMMTSGQVIYDRTEAHLLGIKMAVEQLTGVEAKQ